MGGEEGTETGGTPVYSWKWTVCCRDWDADIFPHKQRRKEAIWVLHGSSWEKTQEDGEGGAKSTRTQYLKTAQDPDSSLPPHGGP